MSKLRNLPGFGCYALILWVTGAILAGCGGSQPPIGAPSTMPQSSALAAHAGPGKSWMLPETNGDDLLYVAAADVHGAGKIYIFSFPKGKLVGKFNMPSPSGECADQQGDVWIVSPASQKISEYLHGGMTPINTLS